MKFQLVPLFVVQEFINMIIVFFIQYKFICFFHFRIRRKTYERLWSFVGHLGQSLKEILDLDQLAPVLSEPHFESLDRRLKTILATIEVCLDDNGEEKVLVESL